MQDRFFGQTISISPNFQATKSRIWLISDFIWIKLIFYKFENKFFVLTFWICYSSSICMIKNGCYTPTDIVKIYDTYSFKNLGLVNIILILQFLFFLLKFFSFFFLLNGSCKKNEINQFDSFEDAFLYFFLLTGRKHRRKGKSDNVRTFFRSTIIS